MITEFVDNDVAIRPFRLADAPQLHDAVRESLSEIIRWMNWCEPSFSLADSEQWLQSAETSWANGDSYRFAIVSIPENTLQGTTWLSRVNQHHKFANLGYWVRTKSSGRGIATSAAGLVAQFGFEQLALNRIEILAAAGNVPSERVAEKLGARREGVLRQRLMLAGQPSDAIIFGLLATDFRTCSQAAAD